MSFEPAIAHGIDKHVGSIEKGKIADLVLWKPSFFAVKPELVVKGGSIAWSQMGDANASIPTPGPVHGRPMFANFGKSLINSSFTFLSKNSIDQNIPNKLRLQKKCIAVENTRNINKTNLKLNSKLPNISVDPQTYEVFSDGELLTCEPLDEVPMAQRYFML